MLLVHGLETQAAEEPLQPFNGKDLFRLADHRGLA